MDEHQQEVAKKVGGGCLRLSGGIAITVFFALFGFVIGAAMGWDTSGKCKGFMDCGITPFAESIFAGVIGAFFGALLGAVIAAVVVTRRNQNGG